MHKKPPSNVPALIVSAPWSVDKMPSLSICALAAYARERGYAVDTWHADIELNAMCGTFHLKAASSELEAISASIAFPRDKSRILRNMMKRNSNTGRFQRQVEDAMRALFESVAWNDYGLVGFSVTHSRLYSSMLLSKWIRQEKNQNIVIIAGGQRVYGDLNVPLLQHVKEFDAVACGEGEITLLDVLESISRHKRLMPEKVRGMAYRSGKKIVSTNVETIYDLDELPVPYFDEYMQVLKRHRLFEKKACPLLLEASRGCVNRCAFCVEILMWRGYRIKTPQKFYREIKSLHSCYGIDIYLLVDKMAPGEEWWNTFSHLMMNDKGLKKVRLSTDLRATTPRSQIERMREAQVSIVLFGCETLSSKVLRDMHKNARVIDNLHALKLAEEYKLDHTSILMVGFPTERKADVQETCANMKHAMAYRPLHHVSNFVLSHGSLVYRNPKRYGVLSMKAGDTFAPYRALPRFLLKKYGTATYEYRRRYRPSSRPLIDMFLRWHRKYYGGKNKQRWLLVYEDKGTRGVVIDLRFRRRMIRLDLVQNEIVKMCRDICHEETLVRGLSQFPEPVIKKELKRLCDLGVLFSEQGDYLALPLDRALLRRYHRS